MPPPTTDTPLSAGSGIPTVPSGWKRYTDCAAAAAPGTLVVDEIVTSYPAGTAPAATIRFVVCPVWLTAVVWYSHVLPTATGNGIEFACTNESELGLGRAPGAERVLGPAPGAERVLGRAVVSDLVVVDALITGAALVARGFAPTEVLPDASPGMSGAVPIGAPVHPARTIMDRPRRTALTDPCLLMQLPRSAGVMLAAHLPVWTHQK